MEIINTIGRAVRSLLITLAFFGLACLVACGITYLVGFVAAYPEIIGGIILAAIFVVVWLFVHYAVGF